MKITPWENWPDRHWRGGELIGVFVRGVDSIDLAEIFTWYIYRSIDWRERQKNIRNVYVEQEFLISYQHQYAAPTSVPRLTSFENWQANEILHPTDIIYWARERNVSMTIVQECPLIILKPALEQSLLSYQYVWWL